MDMSHEKKWLNTLEKLNQTTKLKKENEPIKSFIRLIGLRDKAVHYKPQYRKSVQDKSKGSNVSFTYFNFNHSNARFGVDVVSQMITYVTQNSNLPFPKWLPKEKSKSGHKGDLESGRSRQP